MKSNAGTAPIKQRSLAHAASIWRVNWDSRGIGPRTRAFYESTIKAVTAWAGANGDPIFGRALDRKRLKSLLKSFDDRESMRAGIKTTLNSLIDVALDEGWIAHHPLEKVRLRRLKAKRAVAEWTAADVAAYADAALKASWRGGANLINAMWETSADATDVCGWSKSAGNFIDDPVEPRVLFRRGKTGEVRDIPISHTLAAAWRAADDYLAPSPDGSRFENDRAGDSRRGFSLRRVKELAVSAGAADLLFDHLRHSAATDAISHGASLEDTTALTQHKNTRVLDRVYLQRNRTRARHVQRVRGIIRDEAAA